MDIQLKCNCGGTYREFARTRRRVIYRCTKCAKELTIRKSKPEEPKPPTE